MSGTMGGVAQVCAGHPLDTIKVRLQTQVNLPGKPPAFLGMNDCFRKTLHHEGVRGLYKGATSPLAGAMMHNASIFFFYGQGKRLIASRRGHSISNLTLSDYFLAGAFTGCFVNIIETPVELLKCKLQAQLGKGQYSGVWDCLVKLLKQRGIRGIYQGLGATALRNIPCFALYFYFYELVKQNLTPKGQMPTLLTCFLSGGAAGFGFWALVYPTDIIKTRMQTDATLPADRKYKSVIDCFKKTIKSDGVAGLWKGYTPTILRAVPVNATIFLAVTATKRLLFDE